VLPALWNCAKRSPAETQRVPIRYAKLAYLPANGPPVRGFAQLNA
jgi:hypothetical protein